MFRERKIGTFIEELSSSSPTPGGGTVAALLASIASSLVSMVYGLTTNKKKFLRLDKGIRDEIVEAQSDIKVINEKFLKFMDLDSEAFNKVMEAFKLPKESEEEILSRKNKLQEGYKEALYIPLQIVRHSYKLYYYIDLACNYGNESAITDVGVAALALQSAIEGAVLNVKINASSIDDEEYTRGILQECNDYIITGRLKRDEILSIVDKKI